MNFMVRLFLTVYILFGYFCYFPCCLLFFWHYWYDFWPFWHTLYFSNFLFPYRAAGHVTIPALCAGIVTWPWWPWLVEALSRAALKPSASQILWPLKASSNPHRNLRRLEPCRRAKGQIKPVFKGLRPTRRPQKSKNNKNHKNQK